MDDEGHFFLVDRLKDLIFGGYNVYPRMVEEAIYLHPSVAEVTVIGIDDEYRGQSPKAFVKLKDGERLTESETALRANCRRSRCLQRSSSGLVLFKTIIGKLSKRN